ncbi:MAG: peptidase, partial [Hyphomonas sp.]
ADGFIPNNSSASFGVRLPGCQVADDFSRELGDPDEALLSAALTYRATLACPSTAGQEAAPSIVASERVDGGLALDPPAPGVFDTNRDMTLPPQ